MRTNAYLSVLVFATVTAFSAPAGAAFDKEIVDGLDDVVAGESRLVLDGFGTPHVLYLLRQGPCPPFSFTDVLRYATKSGDAWVIEEVPHETCNPHGGLSMAFAPDGTVHILFDVTHDGPPFTNDLVHGVRDEVGWSFETIETSQSFRDPRIAVDSQGVPHISYGLRVPEPDALKYGVRTESGWALEIVDDTDNAGGYTDLILDPSGNAAISYFAYTTREIRLARQTVSGWDIEVVDSSVDLYGCTSLQVDPQGSPHLAYATTDGGLIYAKKPFGTWEITEVPVVEGFSTSEIEMALDSQGLPHILVPGRTVWDLHYVFLSNGQWVHLQVDDGVVGPDTAIALDSDDVTHITYLDDDNDDLIYATVVSASGVSEEVPERESASRVSLHPNPSRGDLRVVFESEVGQSNSETLGRFVADIVDSQGRRRATLTPSSIEANSIGFEMPRGMDLRDRKSVV